MTKTEFVRMYGVRLEPKSRFWWMRLVMRIYPPLKGFWTTVRFPLCRGVILYPDSVRDPMDPRYGWVRDHELMHVRQQRTLWGLFWSAAFYFMLPLPIWYSGRWFVERRPYLEDIRKGHHTVDSAVGSLHNFYVRPWPKDKMRAWFEARIDERLATDPGGKE